MAPSLNSAVVVDVVRTPSGRGKAGGALSEVHPVDLLATTLRGLLDRNDVDPADIDDVITGCVTQTGNQAVNIGRHAVLAAGLPESVPATTVDRQCGSSQQAVHFAAQGIASGAYESMSRVPMGSDKQGQDAYGALLRKRYPDGLVAQGIAAEVIAARWKIDRDELDRFAARSHQRAAEAAAAGVFDRELLPIDGGRTDETVRPGTTPEKLAGLTPAFTNDRAKERFPEIDWRITAGNSSPLTDGASAALIMSEEKAAALGLTPRARFHSFAIAGDDPILMLMGVLPATRKLLHNAGLSIEDIDVYEVNEAFASVPLAWARELGADPERLNIHGGAIALGHPLGASGTRLLATMLTALETSGGRFGLQTMCEAGGLANAMIVERL